MHVRMYTLAGDPARLGEATRYLEEKVRPQVEAQPGSRGMAVRSNADLGVCSVATYWDSADAMAASERAVQVPRTELTEIIGATVGAEEYEVPVFIRTGHPGPGAGVRMSRIVTATPGEVSAAVEEFRYHTVPALLDVTGLCSAQFLVDRGTGHCVAMFHLGGHGHHAVHPVPEGGAHRPGQGDARSDPDGGGVHAELLHRPRGRQRQSLIEREVMLWNDRDRAGWLALADLTKLEITAPGGLRLSGQEAADTLWDTWNEAFPDNRLTTVSIHADGQGGVFEGRFAGTHSGHLSGPAGESAPDRAQGGRLVRRRARVRRRQDHQHAHLLRPGRADGPSWACPRARPGCADAGPAGQLRRSWISDTTSRMVERSSRDRASETSRAASGTVRSISR